MKNKLAFFISFLALSILGESAHSQFYFGRNKIQFEKFDWQILSTQHFQIYYYPEESQIAHLALTYCEEFYHQLEQKFNHTLSYPVPIVLYSTTIHFQQTNILTVPIPEGIGGFFEFLKQRVVIPYNGRIDDFFHALSHELVHVFFYSKVNSVAADLGAWEMPDFPLWFVEGLAEYWSRGWDAQAEMIIRDALLNDYLYPLNSYELYETGFLLYKEGQAFLRYFEKTYTADRLRALMENYWQYDSFEKAIEGITGVSFSAVETEWRQALRQEMAPALSNEKLLPLDRDRLTRTGANVSPVIYADSSGKRHLLYMNNRTGYTNIYLLPDNGKKEQLVLRGERRADLESLHFLQTGFSVSWSGAIVFVAKSGARDILRIFDIATKEEINSLEILQLVTINSPKWSPDGTAIVFSAQDYSGRSDLYLWSVGQNQVQRLTDDLYYDGEPCFDPTGRWIAFSSDREQTTTSFGNGLYLLDLATKQIVRLASKEYQCSKPSWVQSNPEKILFLSKKNGTANIWQATFDNALESDSTVHLTQLTNYHVGLQDIAPVSADSVVVSALQQYSFQLYKIALKEQFTTTRQVMTRVPTDTTIRFPGRLAMQSVRHHPYKLKYSFDFAQTNVVHDPIFGFVGGAQVGISDLLGNRYYHFLVANTAQTTSEILDHFNLAVTMVDLTHRCNRTLGWFHFANDYYSPYDGFYYERSQGVRAGMNYPVDVFRRLEFSMSLWESYRDYYFGTIRRAFLVSNYASFVHDNTIWTYTGPIDGWSLRLTAGPTFDFRHAQLYNYTALADLRIYYRFLPLLTWAQRWIMWFNEGTDIYRFYIGGSWGLRGYSLTEVYGCKYFMVNQELRFPFAQSLALRFGKTDIRLSPIRAALFFDVGNAWDDDFPGLIGSFGFGWRGVLLGNLVLRLDTGRRTNFHSISKHQFWQFFFGWDF